MEEDTQEFLSLTKDWPVNRGNDVLGLWTPSSVVLFLAQSAQ